MDKATIPQGIEGHWSHYMSGGIEYDWFPINRRKSYTNVFIVNQNRLLLGYKKRGFGKGKYNGFGGKVEPGETSIEAAQRELREEAGVQAPLYPAGTLLFLSEGEEWAFHIDIYRADTFTGTITESDEMRPEWFAFSADPDSQDTGTSEPESYRPIPFDDMWDTDRFWMDLLLSKTLFYGRADFGRQGENFVVRRWWYGVQ